MAKRMELDDRQRRRAVERRLLRRGAAATWFVLRVPVQKEIAVETLLVGRGLMAYAPRAYRWQRRTRYARRKDLVGCALMRRYVFVGFVNEPRWLDLFRLPVIDGVIGVDGCPCELRWTVVDAMIRRFHGGVEAPREHRFMRSSREFGVGDAVRIAEGSFCDHIARVDDIRGRHARVIVEFLGGFQAFKVPLDKLEAA